MHSIFVVAQVDNPKGSTHRQSMNSPDAIGLLRRTRMAEMCFPQRGGKWGAKGGSETLPITIGGEAWCGSEVTSWAMSEGAVTNPHIDTHVVRGERIFLPAAATMRAVRRDHIGPGKRAIVVCAGDKDKVVTMLGLDLEKLAHCQYSGEVNLEGLAEILREAKVRFVLMEFPPECSYIIPSGCAHMFLTMGLIESSTWMTSLKADGPEAVRAGGKRNGV